MVGKPIATAAPIFRKSLREFNIPPRHLFKW
jgi:hypothetical protein